MKRTTLNDADIADLSPTEKVGLVATLNDEGKPHVTLLSSIMGVSPTGLAVGEFSVGLGKEFMRRNKKVGFLVMSLDRRLWRGSAAWTRLAREGEEYEAFNKKPMFRYNAYFGINTVHYLDLLSIEGPEPLPMAGIVLSSLWTMLAVAARARREPAPPEPPLSPYARGIVDALASLSFLAYVGPEGFPRLVPVIQARTVGPDRLAFSPGPFGDEVRAVPKGCSAAIFSMNLGMESVLVRGTFSPPGTSGRRAGRSLAFLDLDWVYNSMPPLHGQVYPRPELIPASESL